MASNSKTVAKVKEVYTDAFGYSGGKKTFTPTVFEALNVPEDQRFSVDIEPLDDLECEQLRGINQQIAIELVMLRGEQSESVLKVLDSIEAKVRLKKNQKKTYAEILNTEELTVFLAYEGRKSSIDKSSQKFALVYPRLSNCTAGKLTEDKWRSMHNKVRAEIYNEVVEISNVSVGETINLS